MTSKKNKTAQSQTFADESALFTWAQPWAKTLKPGVLVGLDGPLGAGKTTLIRAVVCALCGVKSPEALSFPVQSPTFGLMHEYPTPVPMIHVDLYRLEGKTPEQVAACLEAIGFRDFLTGSYLVFVEWFSRLHKDTWRPDVNLTLDFMAQRPQARRLTLETD